jgi:hypothetical protein
MKLFFTAIFVILLLCHDVSAGQTKTDASDNANTPPAVAVEQEKSADKSPKPHQEQSDVEDSNIVGDQGPPLVERVKQLATKTNWALFLSALATVFTGLSWVVSRNGVRVTEKATKAEFQPYISTIEEIDVEVVEPNRGTTSYELVAYTNSIKIENIGKTPATDVGVTVTAKFYQQGRHLEKVGEVFDLKTGNMMPNEPWYFRLRVEFDFPEGDAFSFKRIREMDIYITLSFKDMFSDDTVRKYILHYLCDQIGYGGELQSINEVKNT